jgi:predicted nucleic acid-binding protein
MVAKLFIDTNILIRMYNQHVDRHHEVTQRMIQLAVEFEEIWISRQVLREYFAVMSKEQSWGLPVPTKQLIAQMQEFEDSLWLADETRAVSKHLWTLLQTIPVGGKQVHDANIVATMLANGITHLYTLNRSDFQRFEGHVTLITPDDPAA